MSKFKKDNKTRHMPIGIVLAVFISMALFLRVYLPYDKIFVGDVVKFASNDAYYHMRLVDNLVSNFPHLSFFDPYFIYPGGSVVGGAHFFDWLLAGIVWVVGLGHPTQHIVDVVGAYYPAVLAAIVVIPVYFIGKSLFNKWVGVIAAFLIAVMPGEFLGRSILGATDHHVAEVLFSTMAVMFMILAIENNASDAKLCVYSLLAGFFLGIYELTWVGGLLFFFICTVFFIVQIIINHLYGFSSMKLAALGSLAFVVGYGMNADAILTDDIKLAMVLAVLIPIGLAILSHLFYKTEKVAYFYSAIVGLVVTVVVVLKVVRPDILDAMFVNFGMFNQKDATGMTTLELQPMFFPQGTFTLDVAWGNFTVGMYLAPIAFVVLIWLFVKGKSREQGRLLFFMWTSIIVVLTVLQRRYAYYLVVNVAILLGFLVHGTIKMIAQELWAKATDIKVFVAVLIIGVVAIPNVNAARVQATAVPFSASDDWQESLAWMKNNTPEPFQGNDVYYNYQGFIKDWKYPKPDYGVTAWWDFGYWITRIAHRVPSSNPAQNPAPIKKVAELFLSQDDATAKSIMDELGTGYMIADYATATGKFYALLDWTGKPLDKYIGLYYLPEGGKFKPVVVYYPDYYKSLIVRLYNFDGKSVDKTESTVVIYSDNVSDGGIPFKMITNGQMFTNYQNALDYVATLPQSVNATIVGTNPFVSSIGFGAIPNLNLIYTSAKKEVKIFERGG